MQGPLQSHCSGGACCQSHLPKTTQMDSEAYLQEMQEDNKAMSLNHKLQAGCIIFHCSVPQTTDDMFDVDNTEDLEEVRRGKTCAKMTLTS